LITEIANEEITNKDIAIGSGSTGTADDSVNVNKKEFLDIIKKSISERKQK